MLKTSNFKTFLNICESSSTYKTTMPNISLKRFIAEDDVMVDVAFLV